MVSAGWKVQFLFSNVEMGGVLPDARGGLQERDPQNFLMIFSARMGQKKAPHIVDGNPG